MGELAKRLAAILKELERAGQIPPRFTGRVEVNMNQGGVTGIKALKPYKPAKKEAH